MKKTFEEVIKESMDNYTVAYEPSSWDALEEKLNQASPDKSESKNFKKFLGLGTAIILGLATYFYVTMEKPLDIMPAIKTTENSIDPLKEGHSKTEISQPSAPVSSNKQELEKLAMEKTQLEEKPSISYTPITTENPIPPKATDKAPLMLNEDYIPSNFILEVDFKIDHKLCSDQEMVFTATSTCDDCEFEWDFNGEIMQGKKTNYTFAREGEYQVTVKAANKITSKKFTRNIYVNKTPRVDITSECKWDEEIMAPVFDFTNKGDNDLSGIHVKFNDHEFFKGDFKRYFKTQGNYTYQVIATSDSGCISKESYEVQVGDKQINNLAAPNSFSPNGNSGNDFWMPLALSQGLYDFELIVMDSRGNRVFGTKNKDVKWDGTIAGQNKQVKAGETYIWQAGVTSLKTGLREDFQGSISIIK